jgi:predicted TIM-barrel fold metal-dependent hydrolase
MYYDIHCHVFNKAIVDKRVDILLAPMFKIIDGFERKIPEKKLAELFDKGDNFLNAFMKLSSDEVFDLLDQSYNREFVLTPLMMDLEFTDSENMGKLKSLRQKLWQALAMDFVDTIRGQMTQLAKQYPQLAARIPALTNTGNTVWKELLKPEREVFEKNNFQNQIDAMERMATQCNRVRPFLGIDARRARKQDLVQLIHDKVLGENALFAGVKLYAPTGFSPTDPALFASGGVYSLCEQHGIPITVHSSAEGFSTHAGAVNVTGHIFDGKQLLYCNNDVVSFSIPFFSLRMRAAIKERALTLNHPVLWGKVLEAYPNLKLNLAHFGGREEFMRFLDYEMPVDRYSNRSFQQLLQRAPDAETRLLLERCFVKKEIRWKGKVIRVVYEPDRAMADSDRKNVWNALYFMGEHYNWSKAIFDLLKRYPNVCTDLSCFSAGKMVDGYFSIKEPLVKFKARIYDELSDELKGKFLYGSDFFFILLFGPTMENYIREFREVFGDEFEQIASQNPERFLGIEQANELLA